MPRLHFPQVSVNPNLGNLSLMSLALVAFSFIRLEDREYGFDLLDKSLALELRWEEKTLDRSITCFLFT